MKTLIKGIFLLMIVVGCESNKDTPRVIPTIKTIQGTSLLGKPLLSTKLSYKKDSARINNYFIAEKQYDQHPNNPESLLLKGEEMAGLGGYKKAITIFSQGIPKFPTDARFYEHRGNRYLSLREYHHALADFNKGLGLIQGNKTASKSDLQSNLQYQRGLTLYLQNKLESAEKAFTNSLNTASNNDMRVASTHWLFMVLMRSGKTIEAQKILEPINKELKLVKNDTYHKIVLFYKEEISVSELLNHNPNEAKLYALANWASYKNQNATALEHFNKIVNTGEWTSIAYLAAEADLARLQF